MVFLGGKVLFARLYFNSYAAGMLYRNLLISIALCVSFTSCASSVVQPADLEGVFVADYKRTSQMTIRPSMRYMGEKDGQHYIKYSKGGLGVQKVYRLQSSEARSVIKLKYSENAADWVPCSLMEYGSDTGDYRIIERKVRKLPVLRPIDSSVTNIITC